MGVERAGEGHRPARRSRFADIPTRWSALQGPPREGLDYLYRTYGRAILAYVRARLARGDFSPLHSGDAEDLLHDFFVRLSTTDWLTKPDRRKGRFRPYLVRRLVFFLRERRSSALGKPVRAAGDESDLVLAQLPAQDALETRFEQEWRDATVQECLRQLRGVNASWAHALEAHLRRDGRTDEILAAELGWTVDGFRSHLKRGRAAFRRLFETEERRLDGSPEDE